MWVQTCQRETVFFVTNTRKPGRDYCSIPFIAATQNLSSAFGRNLVQTANFKNLLLFSFHHVMRGMHTLLRLLRCGGTACLHGDTPPGHASSGAARLACHIFWRVHWLEQRLRVPVLLEALHACVAFTFSRQLLCHAL